MRVMISAIAGYGHLCPTIPLAQSIRRAGHDVVVVTSPAFATRLASSGVKVLETSLDWMESHFRSDRRVADGGDNLHDDLAQFFEREFIPDMSMSMDRHVKSWLPDVIMSNDYEPVGRTIAEKYDIPFVLLSYGPRISRQDREKWQGHLLLQARKLAGLPESGGIDYSLRWLHLYFVPDHYTFSPDEEIEESDNAYGIRPQIFQFPNLGFQRRPLNLQRRSGERIALLTFGTVFNKNTKLINAMAEQLAGGVDKLVVLLGPGASAGGFRVPANNIQVLNHAPLYEVLPNVDFCVTHGGTSTLMSILLEGLPSVIIPQGADQIINAVACKRHKLGYVENPQGFLPDLDLTTEESLLEYLKNGVRALTIDSQFARNCRNFRTSLEGMNDSTVAVSLIQRLVETKAPVMRRALV